MKKIVLLILIFIFVGDLYSQAPSGEFSYIKWISTNDTLIVKRKYGDWWFGPRIGTNRNYYFGTLDYTTNNDPGNPFKRLVKFSNGDGGGLMFGGVVEYLPVGEKWGYGLNFSIMEVREVNASSEPLKDTFQTYYDFKSNLNYIVVSPYARLNFLFPGLFTFSGLDVAVNTSQNTSFLKKFQNSGRIEQWQKENLTDLPVSVGFHIGFGYDLFLADISEKARTRLTPFISLNLNSSMIGDNNSTWSGLQLKMGFAVKFGFDNIQYDTLFYDKDYVAPPSYFVTAQKERSVEYIYRREDEIVGEELAAVATPIINEEIKTKKDVDIIPNPQNMDLKDRLIAKPGDTLRYSFAGSATTDLSTELKKDIKKIADILKNNPSWRIEIVGHSDDQGSLPENDRRARVRAENTFNEFRNNKVRLNQMTIDSKGSISPKGDINTPEGRKINRRVEIIIKK